MVDKYIIPQNSYALWKATDDNIVPVKDVDAIAVNSIWVADDDIPLEWYDDDGNKHTVYVNKNDIIIAFYNRHFKYKVIAVKSECWLDNIRFYKEYQEKEKAEWAKRNSNSNCIGDACPTCDACSPCGC